jgi:hypothetical protein
LRLPRSSNWFERQLATKKTEANHPAAGSPDARAEFSRHRSTVSVTHRFL